MIGMHHCRSPRRPSKEQRLREAAAVARALNALRTSEELVHAFTRGCASEVTAIGGGYRARAFGFTATSTAGRYQAVRNWIDQVLLKAGAEGCA
ncbi:hypothetical protein [Paenirhodobacter sp. CAU 1674]|uniref:hypothetical protein n=1 Tax=Paenirhodobacter sp. CAU 1674 TaxID=3032596 RepID=UPI0023DAE837|nr:hypothetical protein [Paenirhodobacter sp. CAU 1674]MDF2141214.1 hypothetical protein [Paenirhodobacter sp. CAU 1674]